MNQKPNTDYQKLVEEAGSIILRLDTKGTITFVNDFALKFFGFSQQELVGWPVVGTIVAETAESGKNLRAMIAGIVSRPQDYVNNENENVRRDGTRVWVAWTNRPVLDERGRLKEVLCVGNDLTASRRAAEKKFEAALEDLAEGVVLCQPNWQVSYANRAARAALGLGGRAAGNLPDLLYGVYQPTITREELSDLAGLPRRFDIVRQESERFKALYLEATATLARDARGEPENILVLWRDVTEARQEELMKQNFLSLVSHKLNTPASVIKEISQLLLAGPLGPLTDRQKESITSINHKALELGALIGNLLTFTTINSQKLVRSQEVLQACPNLKQLASELKEQAERLGKKLDLVIDCQPEDLTITMSRQHFELLVGNLLDNALKFNDSETVKIEVELRRKDDKVEITVADNGRGIPAEAQDKVFDKFYQVDKYFTGNVPGAGLGLPLVKRLAEAYGGTVRLESQPGQGSRFSVELPA